MIDAAGLMVCPGFTDLHTHVDHDILKQPNVHNYIRQGVTTVLGGNCGGSQYPIGDFLKEVEQTGIALNFCTLVGHNTIRWKVMGNADRDPGQKEMAEMKQMAAQAMKEGAVETSTGLRKFKKLACPAFPFFARTATTNLQKIERRFHDLEGNISDTLGSLRESLANIARFTRDLSEDPTIFIRKRPPKRQKKE